MLVVFTQYTSWKFMISLKNSCSPLKDKNTKFQRCNISCHSFTLLIVCSNRNISTTENVQRGKKSRFNLLAGHSNRRTDGRYRLAIHNHRGRQRINGHIMTQPRLIKSARVIVANRAIHEPEKARTTDSGGIVLRRTRNAMAAAARLTFCEDVTRVTSSRHFVSANVRINYRLITGRCDVMRRLCGVCRQLG